MFLLIVGPFRIWRLGSGDDFKRPLMYSLGCLHYTEASQLRRNPSAVGETAEGSAPNLCQQRSIYRLVPPIRASCTEV